jgi:rhamnose transport system permease protein
MRLGWEITLVAIIALVFGALALSSPHILDPWALSDASFNFTEKALIALPMALLIIAREIDISVAAIIALASVAMGLGAEAGFSTPALVGIALNGVLVTAFHVPSIVATIGTMSLFRGIAYGVLGDRVLKAYPADFAVFGQGYVAGPVSFELVLFAILTAAFAVYLHRTIFGRRLYAIGTNPTAARFAGIAVERYRFWLFASTGLTSGLAAVLLTSRLGSTRPAIALGWELEIISMAILGGVAVTGGRGTILGVFLAAILLGLTTFGLALANIPGIVLSIFVGALLIAVVAIPVVAGKIAGRKT